MKLLDRIKTMFKIGGAQMGVVSSLNSVLDHPKINVSPGEYERIKKDLIYFRGEYPDVRYNNTSRQSKSRPFQPLNVAKVVVQQQASILFNEKATFAVEENDNADKFAHDVLDANDFNKSFERYLESMLALGGLAMRPYVSGDEIKIAYVQAPVFFPLRSNTNDVSEAAIATRTTQVEKGHNAYYTLLEFHYWDDNGLYHIDNELYRSDEVNVTGVQVPLTNLYDDLEPSVTLAGLTRPMFIYLKPFGFNNKDITSPLGLSIYDNARPTLDQINTAYDQFFWELKMGQRRVAVPEGMISVRVSEGGERQETFEPDQNIFIGMGAGVDEMKVTDLTTPIRADDYITSINQFLKTLEMQVGLSVGTLSFDGQGLKTATEVVSENSMTYRTRNSHLNNVERAVQELIVTILELGKVFGLYEGDVPTLDDIRVSFDDGVFLDKTSELAYWSQAAAGGLVSKRYAMKKLYRDLSDEELDTMIAEINQEQQPPLSGVDAGMFGN